MAESQAGSVIGAWMSRYINLLKLLNISPNFWISEEYFQKAGLVEKENNESVWIEDDDGMLVFPPLYQFYENIKKIWSDFDKDDFWVYGFDKEFLDYEYLYDPKEFIEMEGHKWMVFRKNCRKFSKRYGKNLIYGDLKDYSRKQLAEVFLEWLEGDDREIHDSDVMLKYVFEGENRKGLWDEDGNLLGLNIWDENYKYVNFRFSFCRRIDFLAEHMRWRFYTDPFILNKIKLVNDGGVLDNPNLEFFKDKMNPCQKRKVYTWIKN